jgi:hypothetical protein
MNIILKTMIISGALSLVSLHSVYAQQKDATAVAKMAIQENIENFEKTFRFAEHGNFAADIAIAGIQYKLTAMKVANFAPFFTIQCSNKELEIYFIEKLKR